MASFSVNCSFTFHNFARVLMKKKLSISRHKLQQGNVSQEQIKRIIRAFVAKQKKSIPKLRDQIPIAGLQFSNTD